MSSYVWFGCLLAVICNLVGYTHRKHNVLVCTFVTLYSCNDFIKSLTCFDNKRSPFFCQKNVDYLHRFQYNIHKTYCAYVSICCICILALLDFVIYVLKHVYFKILLWAEVFVTSSSAILLPRSIL